jgi:leader peptidase (prepilin peptidase)/N-methyltransferase
MTGSFLNVCIYRIPIEKTIVRGRSYCPSCGSLIPWYLNIPVLSYLALRGKCRSCKEPISPIYPIVELINALFTFLSFWLYGWTLTALFLSVFFSILIVISMIDLQHQIIPDGLVITLFILGALNASYRIFLLHDHWYPYVIGIFAASVPLLILGLIYPDGLGGGDVKFMAAAGLFVGWKTILLGLFLGNVIALLCVVVLFFRKKAGRKTQIPFGPFLSLGIVCAIIFGQQLISLYVKLFF